MRPSQNTSRLMRNKSCSQRRGIALALTLAAALLGGAQQAHAEDPVLSAEVLAIVGDRDYGEYLSSDCKTCHQVDGSYDGIPSISHWYEEDFVIAMHAYKQKLRPHPVMQMMAARLSDEEIAALAAYFATVE